MLQIIKNLRDVHENKLHELRRMDQGIEQWVHGGRVSNCSVNCSSFRWFTHSKLIHKYIGNFLVR